MKAISLGHASKKAWGATAGFGKAEKGAFIDSVWGCGIASKSARGDLESSSQACALVQIMHCSTSQGA